MSLETKSSPNTKICPTCGTRVSQDAVRCLVCGSDLSGNETSTRSERSVQGSRMPEITLSLPAILGLFALFLAVGAGLVFIALPKTSTNVPVVVAQPSDTPTPSLTPTETATLVPPTATNSPTPLPTATPVSYRVKFGESCSTIAFAFGVSVNSIVLLNPALNADCTNLREGQELLIPQPTPTPTPEPTSTLSAAQATIAACTVVEYEVKEGDTLLKIALNYQIAKEDIADWNGLVNEVVRLGQKISIPLCKREGGTPRPTATATPPPPYPAVNLLLPADGAPFGASEDTVTLQWAAVGSLRSNEAYAVTIEDVTEGLGRKLVDYVTDTKWIVPPTFRVSDNLPHVYRWTVLPVRQIGTDKDGNPIWEAAGAPSAPRVFTWGGGSSPAQPSATP